MIRTLLCANGLDRSLAEIRRSGKKGELAVLQYEQIVAQLKCRGPEAVELVSKRTKHGEWRIRDCIKYDLGSGYRLITIRCDDRLYIPFVGSHDDADLWLERHRNDGFHPVEKNYREERTAIEEAADTGGGAVDQEGGKDDPYEEQLQAKLDDALLKTVFRGLYQQSPEWREQSRRL